MDDRRIAKIIERRERGYIWLEKELKRNLLTSTVAVTAFFLFLRGFGPEFRFWVFLLLLALVLNGVWNYILYRRKYKDYLHIAEYLDQFEGGNYGYHTERSYMKSGIHSQITEQLERLGHAFATLKGRLEEEKENTKSLVTDISHQLKTPVSALCMSFELMGDGEMSEEEKTEFLIRGRMEVERLTCLLGTLTNLSRMEADMITLKIVDANLKQTLVRAVNGVYLKAGNRRIEIEMAEFQELVLPHDTRWTAEAIANVLDNGIKYSPPGSKIQIRVVPRISYVLVEIEDEGAGIPKAEYPNIFKRFYRGKAADIYQCEGAGVGLYLVRKILEEQGGSVRVVPGRKGSIFQIMLPKSSYS